MKRATPLPRNYWVDYNAGDDSNDGLTADTALRSVAEAERRAAANLDNLEALAAKPQATFPAIFVLTHDTDAADRAHLCAVCGKPLDTRGWKIAGDRAWVVYAPCKRCEGRNDDRT